jgi:hypothetical protein
VTKALTAVADAQQTSFAAPVVALGGDVPLSLRLIFYSCRRELAAAY